MGSTLVNKGELLSYEMLFNLTYCTKLTKKIQAPYFGFFRTGKHEADQTCFKAEEQECQNILLPKINRL